jgi:hypothetical protein
MAATQTPSGGPAGPNPPGDDRPRRTGGGVSRRQLLGAGGGLAALAAAGAVGYELHPGSESAPPPQPKPKPKPTATAQPQTTLERPYVTRPDLSPPEVTITQLVSGSQVESTPRFIALAPDNVIQDSTPWQQGMMLVDRLGRLVWFEPATQGKPFDLKLQTYNGKPALTWWEGGLIADFGSGKAQIADTTLKTIKTVPGANGLTMDLHEFTITPSGAGLATAYDITRADLTPIKGAAHGKIVNCHAQVLDLATGKATFDWNALEHIAVEESYEIAPHKGTNLYDFLHMNSLQMLSDGSILVSARNTWTVYKVNGKTGDIIWRMGGKKSDFKVEPQAAWAWQHHVTMWSATQMTIFDNSSTKGPLTRGLLLDVDETAMTVTLAQEFKNPTGFYSGTLGSVQLMPNGNVFIGWGTQPYFSEHSSDGTLLSVGHLAMGTRSYRAFLVDLVTSPVEPPAMIVKGYAAGGSVVFVSWNGATEIASWRIDAGPHPKTLTPVGTSPWTGFETAIVIDSEGPRFQAVALDSSGNELGRSEVA